MKIAIPTNCPCCNYPLELVNSQLFCRNTACEAQLSSKLQHFCKTLGIKGLGPKTVEKLQLADITELFYLDPDQVAERLGSQRVAQKLIQEIDSARTADLATVLASFSIPLVGATASKKLCAHIQHIDDITRDACKQAGLGDKVTDNLLDWLQTEFVELREFLPFSFQSQTQAQAASSNGKTVCITGKLKSFKTKAAAHAALQAAGYQISDSVTKSTSYLVDEENKSSTKRTKAESLGIPIITDINTLLKETN